MKWDTYTVMVGEQLRGKVFWRGYRLVWRDIDEVEVWYHRGAALRNVRAAIAGLCSVPVTEVALLREVARRSPPVHGGTRSVGCPESPDAPGQIIAG